MFTSTQALGDRSLDAGFDLADTVVGLEVLAEGVSGVGEAETHRGRLVGGFQADLGDRRVGIDRVLVEVVEDIALFVGAMVL